MCCQLQLRQQAQQQVLLQALHPKQQQAPLGVRVWLPLAMMPVLRQGSLQQALQQLPEGPPCHALRRRCC